MPSPAPIEISGSEIERIIGTSSGVKLVVIFGSVARGRARPDSDVDIGILGGGFWEGLRIGAALGTHLGREPQVVDLATANDLLRFHAARDGVLLYEGELDAWPRFRAEAAVRYFDIAPIIALCADAARRRLAAEAQPPASPNG